MNIRAFAAFIALLLFAAIVSAGVRPIYRVQVVEPGIGSAPSLVLLPVVIKADAGYSEPTMVMFPLQQSTIVGQLAQQIVDLRAVERVQATELCVFYNPVMLELEIAEAGDFLPCASGPRVRQPGALCWDCESGDQHDGDGRLLALTFRTRTVGMSFVKAWAFVGLGSGYGYVLRATPAAIDVAR